MILRLGYDLIFDVPARTSMLLCLSTHPSRAASHLRPDRLTIEPDVWRDDYLDRFGNRCTRIVAPPGPVRFWNDTLVEDSGLPDPASPGAIQHAVEDLPTDTLCFLLGSRYCEVDILSEIAWKLFGNSRTGWGRVQAICDWVHANVRFGYAHSPGPRKRLVMYYDERAGVCRDFTHLAITFCRCMGIPARYVTGYLGDIGVPPPPRPWISAPGSKPTSAAAGTPLTPGTISRASAESSWPTAATPSMWR